MQNLDELPKTKEGCAIREAYERNECLLSPKDKEALVSLIIKSYTGAHKCIHNDDYIDISRQIISNLKNERTVSIYIFKCYTFQYNLLNYIIFQEFYFNDSRKQRGGVDCFPCIKTMCENFVNTICFCVKKAN